MANFVQQLNIEGSTYDLHDSEFIVDTRTASGAALTGVSKAPALFDGMQITFWMNYAAASNATLNLTLADGTTTGAIPCYYSGTTRLSTNYAAGNAIRFIYRENVTIGSTTIAAGWWGDANYTVSDTNYDVVGVSVPVKTRLNAYSLCGVVDTNGTIAKQTNTVGPGTYWRVNSFTQSSGTSTSKKLVANQGYYPGKLFYYTGSSAITDAGSVSGTLSGGTSNMDLRYTVNGSTSTNIGVTGAPFFLVGTLENDGLFYPKGHASQATKEWWQCGFPTDLTSTYVYWYVGMMTSKYQCRLSDENWMLKSDGTKWIVFDPVKQVSWSQITGKPAEFTPASHTHGYISNDGAIADAVAATPASGDKIVITDSSDNDKVKGSIAIGSDDGKFLKHDGTWGEEVYTLEVWDHSKDPDWVEGGTQWEWFGASAQEQCAAIMSNLLQNDPKVLLLQTRHYAEAGDALYQVNEFQNNDGAYGIGAYKLSTSNTNTSIAGYNVIALVIDPSTYEIVNGAELNRPLLSPMETDPTPTEGIYGLEYSNGSFSWSLTGGGGPNTPDAPATDGNYVLNVNGGSSSWQEAPEGALIVEFDTLISEGFFPSAQATFSLTDLQAAVGSGRPVYLHINIPNVATINPLIVCSAETKNQYFCCSVIFAQGTPNLRSGGNLERPSYGTFPVESVDETHIKVNLYLLMAGLQDTWVASPTNQTNVIPEKIVNISNGLLSISDSTDSYAVKSPSGLGGTFLYYVLD